MRCPLCNGSLGKVIEVSDDSTRNVIARLRLCAGCGTRVPCFEHPYPTDRWPEESYRIYALRYARKKAVADRTLDMG